MPPKRKNASREGWRFANQIRRADQAAAEASSDTSEIVFRTWEAIW
ncbi:hypothetical protein M2360_005323 [Rhizobium sp. SG_E_25_P2]|nr:hypothetical protein [Rhizobium sp. SG_E_25_P2]